MASRTSRREWVRGLPWASGVGRYDRKQIHSASERSDGYGFLIGEKAYKTILTLTFTKQALSVTPGTNSIHELPRRSLLGNPYPGSCIDPAA